MTFITRHCKIGRVHHAWLKHQIQSCLGSSWSLYTIFWILAQKQCCVGDQKNFKLFSKHVIHNSNREDMKCGIKIKQLEKLKKIIDTNAQNAKKSAVEEMTVSQKLSDCVEVVEMGIAALSNFEDITQQLNLFYNNNVLNDNLQSNKWVKSKYKTTKQIVSDIIQLCPNVIPDVNSFKFNINDSTQKPWNQLFNIKLFDRLFEANNQMKNDDQ